MPAMSTLAIIGLGLAAAGTAASTIQGMSAADDQKKASDKAAANGEKQASLQADQIAKANARNPDIAGITSANAAAAKGGVSSTLLTGSSGVDPSKLTLGKTTLLGG